MAIRRDEAIVLNRIPLRETSLIATLFSKHSGKIKVIIKGIRKERRQRTAAFEPFTLVSVVYYEKLRSELHLCSDVSIRNSYAGLRDRLDLMGHATYLVELVDKLFGVQDPHHDVHELLKSAFDLFPSHAPELVARVFEAKILSEVGWLPILTKCALCGDQKLSQVTFSPRQGGILCCRCDQSEANTIAISNGTRQSLLYFLRHGMEQALRLRVPNATANELERISERFLRYHLEYPLRSTKFLAQLAPAVN
jgi:DNA repair protein RecO (recombination protein O)